MITMWGNPQVTRATYTFDDGSYLSFSGGAALFQSEVALVIDDSFLIVYATEDLFLDLADLGRREGLKAVERHIDLIQAAGNVGFWNQDYRDQKDTPVS